MTDESEIKFTRDDLTALAVVVSIACLLLFFCYKAGYGSGHKDALESGYWHCVPNKSELNVYAPKVYQPKK
jgi:hypothetical protein